VRSPLGPLERVGVVDLQDPGSEEVEPRRDPRADHRHPVRSPSRPLELEILARAPRGAGVHEEGELGREVGELEEPEAVDAEERDAELRVEDGDPAAQESVERGTRAGRGTRRVAFPRFEGAALVSADQRLITEEERREPPATGIPRIAPVVKRAERERERIPEEVPALSRRTVTKSRSPCVTPTSYRLRPPRTGEASPKNELSVTKAPEASPK
jgi:hypothetical protein